MVNYESSRQIPIEDFVLPFSGKMDPGNRWAKLANLLPWDDLVDIYAEKMVKDFGRPGVDPRVTIGALIIKHKMKLSDEETIEQIKENPYMQYFLGFSEYRYQQPFTASLFVSIRKRIGFRAFDKMSSAVVKRLKEIEKDKGSGKNQSSSGAKSQTKSNGEKTESSPMEEPSAPKNKGQLILDATVAPADIKYPTDLDLLNQAREISESLIDTLYLPSPGVVKPRTYRIKARKSYLSVAKMRRKSKKRVRKALKQQLGYLRRNFRTIEDLLDRYESGSFPLSCHQQKQYWIIRELYRQQEEMYRTKSHKISGRIVSIHQPHIRPVVRGKAGKSVEFGAKLSVSLVDKIAYVDEIHWDPKNESQDLEPQVESYKERLGFYPEVVIADTIYGTQKNRRYLQSKGIHYSGPPLGRPPKITIENAERIKSEKKKRKQESKIRVQIEGAFGLGKRRYDLGLVKARTVQTSESWIGNVFFVMNITALLKALFLSLLKVGFILQKNWKNPHILMASG